ncbi:hypothetical protein NXW67_20615 [Bacteroides fragilis]|nr:hypothetical protein [Bacteroides fragilis]MCS2661996.1 hypothetical protein [Bacteroides fragilis]
MTNKLTLPVESRMQGDLHVRFGGQAMGNLPPKGGKAPIAEPTREVRRRTAAAQRGDVRLHP